MATILSHTSISSNIHNNLNSHKNNVQKLYKFQCKCAKNSTENSSSEWEDFQEKGIGHWRFSCVLSFPWKPILSATGYTEYFFDENSGKVCRHVEHWNVPKMTLLKQILKPSRRQKRKD
ncbi:hypothetical protein Leryth_007191 [Lithospermum erythrorhizon]|nr:hypothetical protein Leryth_007191 [Lithospermum erythrorhizon]